MSFSFVTTACAIVLCAAVPAIAVETVLRSSNQGDPLSMAPHALAALVSGEVDLIDPLPLQDSARLQSNPALRVVQGPE